MAAAGGNFAVLSDTVATRDAALPVADLLDQLRSPTLHAAAARRRRNRCTEPCCHSLPGYHGRARAVRGRTGRGGDRRPRRANYRIGHPVRGRSDQCPTRGRRRRLELGERPVVRADSGSLVALLSGRALPDGRPCLAAETSQADTPKRLVHVAVLPKVAVRLLGLTHGRRDLSVRGFDDFATR